MGEAIISQDFVQAIKQRSFTQIGFGVCLHFWVSRYQSEFSDPALPLGGEWVGFVKNITLVKWYILEESWFKKKKWVWILVHRFLPIKEKVTGICFRLEQSPKPFPGSECLRWHFTVRHVIVHYFFERVQLGHDRCKTACKFEAFLHPTEPDKELVTPIF